MLAAIFVPLAALAAFMTHRARLREEAEAQADAHKTAAE
jgi:hypothetical protein